MAGTSPAMTMEPMLRRVVNRCSALCRENFFITFVDAIFTILFERLFTNVFDVPAESVANPCLYPACNAD
jgi:hypothetical protein